MKAENKEKLQIFLKKLKEEDIDEKQKQLLYKFIMELQNGTEIQKNRFILYYGLIPNDNKKYKYSEISREESCSSSAVRCSVSRIRHLLGWLEDEEEKYLVAIMEDVKKQLTSLELKMFMKQ